MGDAAHSAVQEAHLFVYRPLHRGEANQFVEWSRSEIQINSDSDNTMMAFIITKSLLCTFQIW